MKKTTLCFLALLLCASPLWAAPYVDNSNGTITDQATGLVWQQSDDDTIRTWQSALDYCNALTLGSSSSWRLPNIIELRSIVDESRYSPAIDPVFTGTTASYYWSSSSGANNPAYAWSVQFGSGYVVSSGSVDSLNKTNGNYVRCVR